MYKWMTIAVGMLAALTSPSWGDPAVRSYETAAVLPPHPPGGAAVRPATGTRLPAYQVEESLISLTSSLSRDEQLALYLDGAPIPDGARLSLEARVRRLLGDPAVAAHFTSIRDEWFRGALTDWSEGAPLFRTARGLVECKVMIARNLYFRGLTPSAASVREEYERIQRLRNRYGEMEIFAERNVVFAASDDRTKGGEAMFGRPPTVRWLGRRAESMIFLKKGEGNERPAETSARLADSLSTSENLTFVFEGHGRPNDLKFVGGLSPAEVAGPLMERPSRESSLWVSNPWSVVIVNACQAHTYSRALLDLLRRSFPGRQLPVVIVPVEYGDDLVKSVYNDAFFKSELRLSYGSDTHLGALFGAMKTATSVYVPDEDNVLTQIA